MKSALPILAMLACTIGCSNAERAQFGGMGSNFRVTLYSGGEVVKEWESIGKVQTESQSDGWFFMDAKTNKLVRVSGDVAVEQL